MQTFSQQVKFDYEKKYGDIESTWVGHRYFVYDLIANLKPQLIVELGTYKGTSLFSMSQAIKDLKLSSKIYGIDTWIGDKHTGFYDNDVFSEVKKIKKELYKNVDISLIRKKFDAALDDFNNKSIDLLHIDGLHTYKAVKHDFENWFPKVKKDGIILFHDVFEKKEDFGVYRLWEELKNKYDYLEFFNYHGLGLIFKNKKHLDLDTIYQDYYPLMDKLSKKIHVVDEMEKIIIDKDMQLKKIVKKKDKTIKDLTNILSQIKSAKAFKLWQKYCFLRDSIFKKD